MRNLFNITRAEQRVVIFIVIVLVAIAFTQHFLETRSRPSATRSTSTPTATPAIHSSEDQSEADHSR